MWKENLKTWDKKFYNAQFLYLASTKNSKNRRKIKDCIIHGNKFINESNLCFCLQFIDSDAKIIYNNITNYQQI